MTGSEKVFLDTAPFIYWLESHPVYYPKVNRFITESIAHETQFMTSVLSFMEYSVKPQELGRFDLIKNFSDLVVDLNCPLIAITVDVATIAFQLRAKYKSLKGIDALQLAVAIQNGCRQFITNDKRLKVITELSVVVIEDLPD